MITSNITMRTFLISTKENQGTAFSLEYKNKYQFLITALHVIDDIEFNHKDEIEINIYHDDEWKKLKCYALKHENPEIDIVVLHPIDMEFNMLPIKVGLEDLITGRDVYFLGFPYGMFAPDNGGVNYKYPFPFAKKGILSSVIKEDGITTIFLDAHNNSGFSGGPVFTLNKEFQVQIIGVNVSYLQHENILNIEESDDDGNLYDNFINYYENAGIMKAQSIDHAIEIIERTAKEIEESD